MLQVVQRWFDFLNAYNSTLKQRSKNANVNVDVLSRPPLPATAESLQPRYRLTDPSGLAVYFVGASGIHEQTSNIVGLKFGWTGQRLRWTVKRFGWTGGNPRQCFLRERGEK